MRDCRQEGSELCCVFRQRAEKVGAVLGVLVGQIAQK